MAEPGGARRRATAEVSVTLIGPEEWHTYRDVRMAALIDSPSAFWATYAGESDRSESQWRDRLRPAFPTWLAHTTDRPVGTVALWRTPEQPPTEGVLIAMWVASVARGTGVADALVEAALSHARGLGWRRILLDVAQENHRAAGFYHRLGFRPTGASGVMPWDTSVIEETLALDLSP